jgi:hypothetical protein
MEQKGVMGIEGDEAPLDCIDWGGPTGLHPSRSP